MSRNKEDFTALKNFVSTGQADYFFEFAKGIKHRQSVMGN